MLLRYDPFRELDRLLQIPGGRPTGMPMDAYRDGDQFVIEFDLPGVDPGTIDVSVERNALTVRAERNWQPKEGQEVLVAERPQGTFTRQIMLSESIDADRISATYENGVLRVVAPVADTAKPRKVEIAVGQGSRAAIDANAREREQSGTGARS